MIRRCLLTLFLGMKISLGICGQLSEQQQTKFHHILQETRCVTCLNQNLLDSTAPVAVAMRDEILSQIKQGRSEDEIRYFLVTRYGEFVSFRPAMSLQNLVLWGAPWFLMLSALGIIWQRTRPKKL